MDIDFATNPNAAYVGLNRLLGGHYGDSGNELRGTLGDLYNIAQN